MRPVKDSFNILLFGAWNPSIFSQKWMLENLADNDDSDIITAYPLEDPTAPRKISFDGINMYPGRKQLLLSPEDTKLKGSKIAANKLTKILDLLNHTPLGNYGINFRFIESNNLKKLQNDLDFDSKSLIDSSTYELLSSNVTRSFKMNDKCLLNFTISDTNDGIVLAFNFHHDLTDISNIKALVTEDYIEERYNQAILFCENVYNLSIEEE